MRRYCFLCLLLLCVLGVNAQLLYNAETLAAKREQVKAGSFREAYDQLLRDAQRAMAEPITSVMDKQRTPPSGSKHDYMSIAPYAWPNPNSSDGLPWKEQDGRYNAKEVAMCDLPRLQRTAEDITTLALAWYFSGDESYAKRAVAKLDAWFLNTKTRMNPSLDYCQVIPGTNGERGYNTFEGIYIAQMLNGVVLLEQSSAYKKSQRKKFRRWVKKFYANITTSNAARFEERLANNHAVNYDTQRLYYLSFMGRKEELQSMAQSFPERRLAGQIMSDGTMPKELKRTCSFTYTTLNVGYMIDFVLIARNQGVDISDAPLSSGGSIRKAVGVVQRYAGKSKQEWPYQELNDWATCQRNAQNELYRWETVSQRPVDAPKRVNEHLISKQSRFNLLY